VRTERADRLLRICGPQLAGPAERDQPAEVPGWATFQMPFVNEGAARGALLGFGTDVEVLAPSSLRRHFAETAAAIVRLYR
jgi:predicted DNA-binding transcriptional regulator YafY